MIGLVELATSDDGTFWTVVEEFSIEMIGGAVVGVAGAAALLPLMRRARLPEASLYPLRVLAAAGVIYGAATLVHGSGFLAVFIAGLLIGDSGAPRQDEIEGFHSSLASLAERRCDVGSDRGGEEEDGCARNRQALGDRASEQREREAGGDDQDDLTEICDLVHAFGL